MRNSFPSDLEVEIKAYNDGYNGLIKENIYATNDLRYHIYNEAYIEGEIAYSNHRKARKLC